MIARLALSVIEFHHCYLRYGRLLWNTHELKISAFCILSAFLWSLFFLFRYKGAVKTLLLLAILLDWIVMPLYLIIFHVGLLYNQPVISMWGNHTLFMVLIMSEGMITMTEYYKDQQEEYRYWYAAINGIVLMFLVMLLYVDGSRAAGHKLFDLKFRRDIFLSALDDCYMAVHGKSRIEYIKNCTPSVENRLADEDLVTAQREVVSKFAKSVKFPVTPISWGPGATDQTWHIYCLKHIHTFLHVVLASCLLAMAGVCENFLRSLNEDGNRNEEHWRQFYLYGLGVELTLLLQRLLMQKIYSIAFSHAAYAHISAMDAKGSMNVSHSKLTRRLSSNISRDLCDHVKPCSYFFQFDISETAPDGTKKVVRGTVATMLDSPRMAILTCAIMVCAFLIFAEVLPHAIPEDTFKHMLIANCCFFIQYVSFSTRRQHRNLSYHFDDVRKS